MYPNSVEKNPFTPHQSFHVWPNRIGALGEHPVGFIEHFIEDLMALVGQPDLVGIGIHQGPTDVSLVPVTLRGVQLTPNVLDRF